MCSASGLCLVYVQCMCIVRSVCVICGVYVLYLWYAYYMCIVISAHVASVVTALGVYGCV